MPADTVMNIVLAAQEMAGLQVLKQLARSSHRVVAVLTEPPRSSQDGRASLWNVASDLGFKTWPARMVKDPALGETLRSEQVDILLNVHSLFIIHPKVLAAPRFGAYNLHPALLPRYAGLNSVSWAILHGEKEHGVTIHKMEPGIDTGAIVYQEHFPVGDEDTALALSFRCTQIGVALIFRLLDAVSATPDALPLIPQELSGREYFGKEVPNGGDVCWKDSAERIVNFVRAFDYFPFRSPWGEPRTKLRSDEINVIKASRTERASRAEPGTVDQVSESGALVAGGDQWVLVKKLKLADKYFAAADLLKPGDRLEASAQRPMGVSNYAQF
jgi:UDP-4-amino-4-deoxy-L-arabinose formyltransferase/UDP-glucuronic acid dehydrogenase (UDP-4-keto-hexauronic acid decarboxylating)